MADEAARVGSRKRGAPPLPPPPAPPQPAHMRAPSGAPEHDDDEVFRLRAALEATVVSQRDTVAAQAATIVAQAAVLVLASARAERLVAAVRAGAPLSSVTSAASPALFLAVLARLAENGYAREVVRCMDICKDARSNAQLWERVVDLQQRQLGESAGYRTTRLIHWAGAGDLARVRETLGRCADVNARDTGGSAALWWASYGGHLAVVRELLDRGADVEARTRDGITALAGASFHSHTAVVVELAARGANINARDGTGCTPLVAACAGGHAAAVTELLRLGANVNAQTNGGWSALIHAAYYARIDAVRVLLVAPGVDVNLVTTRGRTALSRARAKGHTAIVALLEAAGAR